MDNETTELLERPCSVEQAREVCEVFGNIESPTIYHWILSGLAKKAHNGNASAAKELHNMIKQAEMKEKTAIGSLSYDDWYLMNC